MLTLPPHWLHQRFPYRRELALVSTKRCATVPIFRRAAAAPVEAYLSGIDGAQSGDPEKAALAMIAVAESNDPPLRLLLGVDAIGLWETKQARVAADLARCRAAGEATAFEGVTVRPVGG